ncbi:MAG: Pr6Pr family membrane protein [Bacilli bacterium]|nr:Pr6Pr family membrane protein [Bacilli bacterium]
MIKNRTTQLIFQTTYLAFGFIGILASLGLFAAKFQNNFYVYFTNLSNYICIGIMLFELIETIKKNKNSYVKFNPLIKFMGILMILLTFFVFNVLLADDRTLIENLSVSSLLLHVALPIMFVLDWILFYERRQTKWYYPLLSILVPLIYVIFIYLRAFILNGKGEVIYPYFFFNINEIGLMGVGKWILILLITFIVIGYLIYFLDKIIKKYK